MNNSKVDVIVVGAGLAGSSAAIRLAQGGKKVVLIDRGMPIGSKNLSGGVLWGNDLEDIIPGWQSEAPIERVIVNKRIGFLSDEDATVLDMFFDSWNKENYSGVSILRVKFDSWLADKAIDAGVIVLSGILIDSLIIDNGRVLGIKQENEVLYAETVIIAEGSNARLLLNHGLIKGSKTKFERKEMMIGIKEVFALDPSEIESRFLLSNTTGASGEFILGNLPNGIQAGGFFYTNLDSISLGVVIHLDSICSELKSYEIIEYFKQHPLIAKYIDRAVSVEYGAKTIPEIGYKNFPPLYGNGYLVVGDAAGFVFSNGLVIQGMNYAIKSGILAAETILEGSDLSNYKKKLNNSYVLKDFKKFRNVKKFTKNHRLFSNYPLGINNALKTILTENGEPKKPILKNALKEFRKADINIISLARDFMSSRHI
ncbi:MAG: FAD-dependent oxidoreductase [Candidatus Heimdallarchaeota archaeon]|nr:FAD-dependent oxidoreductase [Candidatus Heimdallarchaeota archaeon]